MCVCRERPGTARPENDGTRAEGSQRCEAHTGRRKEKITSHALRTRVRVCVCVCVCLSTHARGWCRVRANPRGARESPTVKTRAGAEQIFAQNIAAENYTRNPRKKTGEKIFFCEWRCARGGRAETGRRPSPTIIAAVRSLSTKRGRFDRYPYPQKTRVDSQEPKKTCRRLRVLRLPPRPRRVRRSRLCLRGCRRRT